MGLNVSKGNMYEFITHTWNTVKGQCYHDCSYCYMKRWGTLNPARLDHKELHANLGTGNFIFIGSSCDLFAENIPVEWIEATILHTLAYRENQYLYQTKDPSNLLELIRCGLPLINASICTTIETNRIYPDIMNRSPHPYRRSDAMREIASDGHSTYVTIEPIMQFDLSELTELVMECRPKQVNIGADSGRHNLPEPDHKEVAALVGELNRFTKVHMKSNLKRIMNKDQNI